MIVGKDLEGSAIRHWPRAFAAALLLLVLFAPGHVVAQTGAAAPVASWPSWGDTPGGLRYSEATQITPENVGRLKVAWTYRMGESHSDSAHPLWTFEATPIIAEGRMYVCSNVNKIVALDPGTGKEIWSYDPKIKSKGLWLHNCRGVTYYHDDAAAAGSACAGRILEGTLDGRLIAVDAAT